MSKTACYLTGGGLTALASVCVWSASFARIEEAGDFESLIRNAVLTGGMFALALILFCAPRMSGAAWWRYAVLAGAALALWVAVSGRLIWLHEEHFRAKSMNVSGR